MRKLQRWKCCCCCCALSSAQLYWLFILSRVDNISAVNSYGGSSVSPVGVPPLLMLITSYIYGYRRFRGFRWRSVVWLKTRLQYPKVLGCNECVFPPHSQ